MAATMCEPHRPPAVAKQSSAVATIHDQGAGSSIAADWSQLPKDILNLICQRLDNELDLIRLRSICSHWRSSSVPNYHTNILPFKFPLLKCISPTNTINKNTNIPFCSLSKRNLFLIKPPPQQQEQQTLIPPWLIRVTQNSTGKTKLSQSPLLPFDLPSTFQFSLDLNKFSVLRLGTDFIIDFNKGTVPYVYMYPKKVVAVTPLILGILLYNDHLVLLRCGDELWTDMLSSIVDICIFKGHIYAIEEDSGKTVIIRPEDLSVQLVADEVCIGGDIQFLVESEGKLLLVDIFVDCLCSDSRFKHALTIDVFMLDEKEKEWVKLTSLGDRVLFLGNECSFSASASDLSVARGNCVVFMDDIFEILDTPIWHIGMCVYHLDQCQLLRLSDYPDYLNLFWPPPVLSDKISMKNNMNLLKKSMIKKEKPEYLCMDVSSYSEFDNLVQQYVIAGGAPAVSFDISDNVDAQSYGHILDDIIANNKNLDRFDKIENPRSEHYPRPVVSCYTVREMDKVSRAIGCCWRAIMLERPEYSDAKANKIMSNMDLYRETSGMIIDHDDDRGLSDDE